MKLKLEIPDYISIGNFKKLSNIEHLEPLNKMVEIVHIFTGIDRDEIRTWDINSVVQISDDLTKSLEANEEFYPIIEYNGELLGYRSITKMKTGEFMDLERLSKDVIKNFNDIIAILYRPITNHSLDEVKFKYKNSLKIYEGEVENMIKYYSVEDYNSEKRPLHADKLDGFPIHLANGAVGFFLGSVSLYLNSTNPSSTEVEKEKIAMEILNHLGNIGGGLRPYTIYQKVPFLTSQEVIVY